MVDQVRGCGQVAWQVAGVLGGDQVDVLKVWEVGGEVGIGGMGSIDLVDAIAGVVEGVGIP